MVATSSRGCEAWGTCAPGASTMGHAQTIGEPLRRLPEPVAGRRGVSVVGAGDHGARDLDARELVGRGHITHDRLDLDAEEDLAVTQHSIPQLGVEGLEHLVAGDRPQEQQLRGLRWPTLGHALTNDLFEARDYLFPGRRDGGVRGLVEDRAPQGIGTPQCKGRVRMTDPALLP